MLAFRAAQMCRLIVAPERNVQPPILIRMAIKLPWQKREEMLQRPRAFVLPLMDPAAERVAANSMCPIDGATEGV
jgi:hypothetical protein